MRSVQVGSHPPQFPRWSPAWRMCCAAAWDGPDDEAERLTCGQNHPPPPRTAITRQRIDYHISCQTFVVLESGLIKLCMQLITSGLREGLATCVGGQGLDRWSETEVAKHPPEISRRIIIHGHVTSLASPAAVGSNPFSSFT